MNHYVIDKKENVGEQCWFLNFKSKNLKISFREKDKLFLKEDLRGLLKNIKYSTSDIKLEKKENKCFHFKCGEKNDIELLIEILNDEIANQDEATIISNIQTILFEAEICFEKPEHDPSHNDTTETTGIPGS